MGAREATERVRDFIGGFSRDGGGLLAAAVAYGSLFALTPALVMIVLVGGMFVDRRAVAEQVFQAAEKALGSGIALQIQRVATAYLAGRGDRVGVGIIGALLLVWTVGMLFGKLQQAFDMLWHVRLRDDLPLATRARLTSSRFLFALLPVALAVTATITANLSRWISSALGFESQPLARFVESPFSAGVVALGVLLILYRLIPYAEVRIIDVVWPAVVVATIWTLGTHVFGIYLSRSVTSAAVAAGSVFALLLWLNFSAWVMLLGCSACRLVAEKRGRGGPDRYAEYAVPAVNRD